ncbi:MAG: hypothetical protein CW716_01115, partial [Candidatus Bathyarchaeum sp.]
MVCSAVRSKGGVQAFTVIVIGVLLAGQSLANNDNQTGIAGVKEGLRDNRNMAFEEELTASISELTEADASKSKVELLCLEIDAYICVKKYGEAAKTTNRLLDALEHDGCSNVVVIDKILSVCALLKSGGLVEESRRCEERIIQLTAEDAPLKSVPTEYLERAFFRGQYDFLIRYGQKREDLDGPLHRLVGRAAGTEFVRYWKVDTGSIARPNEVQGRSLKHLATVCTRYYEAAVKACCDQYARTQLAYEWLPFKANRLFYSDSPFLRRQFPTEASFENEVDKKKLEDQAKRFQVAVAKAMESGKQGQLFAAETRSEITASLTEEFKIYALIGIPDNVFEELIEDIPFFFDEGMPVRLFKGMSHLSEMRRPLTWYLWIAIMRAAPDTCEREEIERQFSIVNGILRDNIKKCEIPKKYRVHLDLCIQKWESIYDRLKDCRFVPYFDRALPSYRFNIVFNKIVEELNKHRFRYEVRAKELSARPNGESEKKRNELY